MLLKRLLLTFLTATATALLAQTSNHTSDWVQTFHVKHNVASEQSNYQDITIFENETLGKILMLDGIVQFSEKDEFIYHEMLVHVPLMAHPEPKSVLIIGGGDGACAREVLKHPQIEEITVVELDGRIVDVCKKHFNTLADGSLDNPKVQLVLDDGFNFVKKNSKKFDVIIVSSSDPLGPAKSLFHKQFFKHCKDGLKQNGILACQIGSPVTQELLVRRTKINLSDSFKNTHYYFSLAPCHLGGIKAYSISLQNPKRQSDQDLMVKRYKAIQSHLQYYSPALHQSAFLIPEYIKTLLESSHFEDDNN